MPLLFPVPFCLHSWWFADLMQSDVVVGVVAVILRLCLGMSCGEHCVCLDQSFVSANATIVAVLVFCGLQRLNFNFAIHGISQFFFFFGAPMLLVCLFLAARSSRSSILLPMLCVGCAFFSFCVRFLVDKSPCMQQRRFLFGFHCVF